MKKRGGYKRGPLFRVEADTRQTLFHSYCSRFGSSPEAWCEKKFDIWMCGGKTASLHLDQQIFDVFLQDYCTSSLNGYMLALYHQLWVNKPSDSAQFAALTVSNPPQQSVVMWQSSSCTVVCLQLADTLLGIGQPRWQGVNSPLQSYDSHPRSLEGSLYWETRSG